MNVRDERKGFIVCLLLAAVTLAVFHPVVGFEFINLDDQVYVYQNPHVQAGITPESVRWSFTTLDANFWHPLTWLSHMLDWQLFGPPAAGHHAMGLLFHVANTLLLFLALVQLTSRFWESAVVAVLFALHPLHVESVAWVSERKDVLSTLFFMLVLIAYPRYVEKPSTRRYLGVIVPYALGLMAKPMLVTVPFVLLLLDFWPLRRFGKDGAGWRGVKTVLLEKIPFVVMALIAGALAIFAQARGSALADMELVPLEMRLSNAAVSTVVYLWKTIWPIELAVHYPLQAVPPGLAMGAGLLLAGITALALAAFRRWPYVTVGWLWYLGTLAPVSGLIQVGAHSMADRYTYIPLIGIFILGVWGVSDLLVPIGHRRRAAAFGAVMIALLCTIATGYQLQFWRDSETLFRRALAVTSVNGIAENNLATALTSRGEYAEALPHILRAAELRPTDEEIVFNVGNTLAGLGREEEAKAWLAKSIQMNPRFEKAYTNLGALLIRQKLFEEAIASLRAALELNPASTSTRLNLATALAATDQTYEASAHLEEAVRLAPGSRLVRAKAVQTWWKMGMRDKALVGNEWIRSVDGNLAEEMAKWMEAREKESDSQRK